MEVDNESGLAQLLEGRTIAILGQPLDNYTSEALEPTRRLEFHDQLLRARQLRAQLEEAATLADALPFNSQSSYPKAMSILQSSLPQINQLVRLTEAIRGKHTINNPSDYDEWNEWAKKRNVAEVDQRKREQRILRRQLRDFAKERNPIVEIDEELEARHDSLILKPKDKRYSEAEKLDTEEDWKMGLAMDEAREREDEKDDSEAYDSDEFVPQTNVEDDKYTATNELTSRPSSNRHVGVANTIEMSQGIETDDFASIGIPSTHIDLDNEAVEEFDRKKTSPLSHALLPLPKKAKVVEKNAEEDSPKTRKSPPETQTAPTEMRKPPPEPFATKRSAKAGNKARTAKKCHDCKASTARHRLCSYWKLNGTRCRKVYCIDCLSNQYTLGDDVQSSSNPNGISIDEILNCPALDEEWHCPSCLGTCQCKVCVNQRKREEDLEKSRAEASRKSSRRSAGNSYSFFF